MMNPEFKIL